MRLGKIALVLCAWVAVGSAALTAAVAQDDGGALRGIISELLGDAPSREAAERRVPFGRGEIQLSFAPLVEETAPAVVNV